MAHCGYCAHCGAVALLLEDAYQGARQAYIELYGVDPAVAEVKAA